MAGGTMMPEGQPPAGAADSLARQATAQQGELARDQQIGRRVLLGQRLWFLVVVPAGLIAAAFIHGMHPLWPYPAVLWATGPVAALLGLLVCRRSSRQPVGPMPGPWSRRVKIPVPLVTYTSQTIAAVTLIVSLILVIFGGLGAYLGSRGGQGVAPDWHLVIGVLPALVLAIIVLVVSRQLKRRGESGAGAA